MIRIYSYAYQINRCINIFQCLQLHMQQMNEERQEDDNSQTIPITTPQNMQKIQLIDDNVRRFRSLTRISLAITTIRLVVFFIIILNDRVFICEQLGTDYSESWNAIFYILASMMDCLVMLNDLQLLRFLRREQPALDKVKKELQSNSTNISNTSIGKYSVYLSIFEMIKHFKYRARSQTSISQTIRYLSLIITFYTFGNLALNAQNTNNASAFKSIFLWAYILTIYFNVFELDFLILQTSQGEFVECKVECEQVGEESQQLLQIKQNYIRRIRRPFEIVYILSILLLLAIIVMYYSSSLLSCMMVLSIATNMSELVYEKYLQNRLMLTNLAVVPKKHLTPHLILREVTKGSRRMHLFICISHRLVMVMLIMAYFRSQPLEVTQSFMFFFANLLLFFGQNIKFNRAEKGKLYLLHSKMIGPASVDGSECSICLIHFGKEDRVVELPCFNNHIYHYSCMANWFKERKQCPLCRHSLQIYELIQ